MARLTVEQKWWIDPRRTFLMNLIKPPGNVDGLMIQVWRMAQEYWGEGQLMPWRVFSKFQDAEKIVDADLAELRDGAQPDSKTLLTLPQDTSNTFVYVRGSEDFFTWILDVREKRRQGGITAAQGPRDEKGRLVKKAGKVSSTHPALIQHSSSPNPAPSSTIQVSGSGSGSDSGSGSKKEELKGENEIQELKALEKPARPLSTEFIGTYVKAWQGRYGPQTRPSLTGKVQGQIRELLKNIPTHRAIDLIQVYFQIDDPWFVTKCHDFGTFIENLDKIGLALDTGDIPGKPKRRGIEELLAEEQQVKRASS